MPIEQMLTNKVGDWTNAHQEKNIKLNKTLDQNKTILFVMLCILFAIYFVYDSNDLASRY